MAIRTTEERVQAIISYDLSLIPEIDQFIADASLIVDNVVAIDSRASAATLELIERYICAHLIAVTDPRVKREQVKSLAVEYAISLDKGFGITTYGTVAMTVDTTGRLTAFNNRLITGGGIKQFFWAGLE
jgi:hypothetical protein